MANCAALSFPNLTYTPHVTHPVPPQRGLSKSGSNLPAQFCWFLLDFRIRRRGAGSPDPARGKKAEVLEFRVEVGVG